MGRLRYILIALTFATAFLNASQSQAYDCPDAINRSLFGSNSSPPSCSNSGSAPANGFQLNTNSFQCSLLGGEADILGYDNGVREAATSLSCPGCVDIRPLNFDIPIGASSPFTAIFNVSGNTQNITVTGTYSRSADG